ncbi:MAG: alcohol dehydrogenase catalytic domain-containing protein [Sphaerochaetaceae bacterium]|nr:alcohol dehydrogenase catalytic domain-containing protein [Sphaerochaetaceae bacterium]
MKAVFLDGAKNLQRLETAVQPIRSDEVRIRVHTMGICGSDIEYYLHGFIGKFVPKNPLVLGHELSGEVVEVGGDVKKITVGSRVAIDPSIPCRQCEYCRNGRHNLCENLKFVGTAATFPHIHGGLAEFVNIPAVNCFTIPSHMSWGEGACLEPASVAVQAVLRPGNIAGAAVLITGGGTIGQFISLAARAFGARTIAVSDLQQFRREVALESGADMVIDPADAAEMSNAIENTGGFDLIFEASGSPEAVKSAFEVIKRGGTIVQVGSIPKDITLPANLVMSKELQYIGSFRYTDIYPITLDMLSTRRIDSRPLISNTFNISKVTEAFEIASQRGNIIKVQVEL